MTRLPRALSTCLAALTFQACRATPPAEHYGFVARLGVDTVSVEDVSRTGDILTIEGVDRFPIVRRRHTEVQLTPDGSIRHLSMDINTPSEPEKLRDRHVEADVSGTAVHLVKRGKSDTVTRDFNVANATVVAHVPQMYSLYELYFEAARKHDAAPHGDDTIHLRQFYIDREFDRFPVGHANVHLMSNGKAEIWHDWLAGIGQATLDSTGHLLAYSGAHTTYKVEVERTAAPPDVQAIGERFAATELKTGAKQLSVRDMAGGTIGGATFTVDYGRPLARGRVLLGDIIPYDRVWRTGANAATQFTTSAPISLAGLKVPTGKYTLWTIPHANGTAELIVNKQSGQWGTEYDDSYDLGHAAMKVDTLSTPTEEFTISIVPSGARNGTLVMEWGPFRWTAPIDVIKAK